MDVNEELKVFVFKKISGWGGRVLVNVNEDLKFL